MIELYLFKFILFNLKLIFNRNKMTRGYIDFNIDLE